MTSINKWYKYLINEQQADNKFARNVSIIRSVYGNSPYSRGAFLRLIGEFTPENSKILTQIELESVDPQRVMGGAYGKLFPIKNSDLMLKMFTQGVNVKEDMERMKKISDEVFSGKAGIGKMHYFEVGELGEHSDDSDFQFKYVIMPRIVPFEESITYKLDPKLFQLISRAVHTTVRRHAREPSFNSYTTFFEKVINNINHLIEETLFYVYDKDEKRKVIEEYASKMDEFQDTISKILRVAYKTYAEEGGTDLHLGNLGFFAQKPDDWFFFDM
jgi:hypothetical protein